MEQEQQKFSDLSRKILDKMTVANISSVFSYLELENLKSIMPSIKTTLTLINFSGKQITLNWINYDGKVQRGYDRTLKQNNGFSVKLETYTNHLYRIQFEDSSDKIHFRVPEDKTTLYIGNDNEIMDNFLKSLYDSCWITNPSIKLEHLEHLEKIIDNNLNQLNNAETILIQSFDYDDSNETAELIESFYQNFSCENKFTDPFFNPLNELESTYTVKRVSEHQVGVEKKVIPSVYWGEEFKFTIKNDTDSVYTLYWVTYCGKIQKFNELAVSSEKSMSSHLGNVWAVGNENLTYIFQCGKKPLLKTECTFNISSLQNPHNFCILGYEPEKTESLIIHPELRVEYNSQQGNIGNCWFLKVLISIYAMYPEKIVSLFIKPEMMNSSGVVMVKFWSRDNECWRLVIIDDYLPINNNDNWFCSGPLGELYNIFWVPLIEKAVAKQLGSFKYLEAELNPICVEGLFHLILGPELKGSEVLEVPKDLNDFSAFDKLVENFKKKNVCSMASRHSKNNNLIDRKTGMVSYHGYGLLDIIVNVCSSRLTFVKCQNTWSNGGEWSGDWGDSSELWDKFPRIKEALNFEKEDDGTFWIEKKDFNRAFERIWIAKLF